MPNIPSIKIGDTTYDVKDQVARDHLVEVGTAEPIPQSMHPDNRLYVKDYGSAQDEEAHTYVVPTIDEFNDLKSVLNLIDNSYFSQQDITSEMHGNHYIATNVEVGATVSLTPVIQTGYFYGIFDCVKDERFVVSAKGGGTPRAWAFVDSSNKLISKANNEETITDTVLQAPANGKLIINTKTADFTYYVKRMIPLREDVIKIDTEAKNDIKIINEYFDMIPDTINLYDAVNNSEIYTSNEQYRIGTVYLNGYYGDVVVSSAGNMAAYFQTPGGSAGLTAYDENGNATSLSYGSTVSASNPTRQGKVVTIPQGTSYFTFVYRIYHATVGTLAHDMMVTKGSTLSSGNYVVYRGYHKITETVGGELGLTPVYVSLSGNDSNDGLSISTAFATFSKALSVSKKVYVQRGDYNQTFAISNVDGITIMPYDNDETYAHTDPVREKITINGTSSSLNVAYFNACNDLYLEDVVFDTASGSAVKIANSNGFTLVNCEAKNSVNSMGFEIVNCDGIFNNCYATGNKIDGFNFHGYGATIMNDCVSESNLDDGCSHHDGCIGTINGGRFSSNGKCGIAPAYGANVNIYNAVCDGNYVGIGYLSTENGHASMKGIMSSCVMVGSTAVGLIVNALCAVTAIDCKYSNNATDKQVAGTLVEY